ncbi:TonB-dependent receptor [Flavobacterium amniphilum]|uniref:TonB-dependent receptor n=1 Tax=Flavobacterium amniphilum TaxID=1834035 RepID=UPI00202A8BD3|nr:TonB-dependent receptor [Flavobacterium amniphilum]MCL9804572.1 TonB-dependent receptor [Flavobacterium amniphilum]
MKKIVLILFGLFMSNTLLSQSKLIGKVSDESGQGLPGVNISVTGGSLTTSDFEGKYQLNLSNGNYTISFSFLGFKSVSKEITIVDGENTLDVTMIDDSKSLEEVVVVGSRSAPRSNTTTALPIDLLSTKDLASTGQASFDKALQYRIPSFNTVQTPVNDATSLLDPYEIRNMGPSRTLILINGKRKNMSALLYTQTSPGRGETGADISAIPQDAIERVEILRDGASAQYGSDAIAGVMNIILKNSANAGSATLRTGITGKGGGEMLGVSINNGTTIFEEKGFLNYTIDFSKTKMANRPGKVDAQGEANDFGADINDVQEFLDRRPDAGNINASPETATSKFEINGGVDVSDKSKFYFNGAYVYKKVNSFANYRTPYWRSLADYPFLADFFPADTPSGYDGYVPTFEGDLNDYNATVGIKSKKNGWNTDLSITFGGNKQEYSVNNSFNRSDIQDGNGENVYLENSPISFKPGGTSFNHIVGNIDINKIINDHWSFGIGSEFRTENFAVLEGDRASWEGVGADSFAGNRPENSGKWNRYNLGAYAAVDFDPTKDFQISGTLRAENYSDFGSTAVWKLSSRYKFMDDKVTLRASLSTGFRAPSLHQIYTQKSQYSFVAGQGIQVSGLINNVSPQARLLDIDKLKAEKSKNFTLGMGIKPTDNFSATIDYYNITVDDRIVLSDEMTDVTRDGKNLGTLSFFTNALDTRTSGLDVVLNYKNIEIGTGNLGFNLSGNYTFKNEKRNDVPLFLVNDATNETAPIIDNTQERLLFSSRPKTKWILGTTYDIGKFGFNLNNTLFGKTRFQQAGIDSNLETEFVPKVVTDLGVNFNLNEKITIAFNANNILNVLPEWKFVALNDAGRAILSDPAQVKTQSNLITFNQRYSRMTYDGYHFSQLGSMFSLSLNYKL